MSADWLQPVREMPDGPDREKIIQELIKFYMTPSIDLDEYRYSLAAGEFLREIGRMPGKESEQ